MTRAILLIFLVAFLPAGLVCANDAPVLTGSTIDVQEAALKSDVIFLGEVAETSIPICTSLGRATCSVKIKHLRLLRGSVYIHGHFEIDISLLNPRHMDWEEQPKAGRFYLFFINRDLGVPKWYVAQKLLAASDENIAMVKKLILN